MSRNAEFFIILLFFINCIAASIPPFEEDLNFEFNPLENKLIPSENEIQFETKSSGNLRTPVTERSIYPTHYNIKLRPIFDPAESISERFTIPSSIVIQVNCLMATKAIRLDCKEIRVQENRTNIILKARNQELVINSQNLNPENHVYEINLANSLQPGETYELHLEYIATIFRDRLDGIYLSNYTNPNTKELRYLATSHFEPDGARQAFPCFDEPDLKAVFEISVGRREGYNSLSNVDLNRTEPIPDLPDWYWDHYNPTVKMSSYLVAVVVSDYKSATADSKYLGGKPVKIWAAPHYIFKNGGSYAAETAGKILEFYESYFDRKYPLPKMDSVAIPHFSAGAMENYGLNTYREKYLLYFHGETTESARYGICSVIAHELAHQWFGNLVTCKTWSQLWLNEGFAAYVETIGETAACPEFDSWSMFLPATLQTAFIYDQSPDTHPIVNDTNNMAKFTKITYNKGASLIRMMQGFLGESTLRKGLQNYLKTMAFNNAHQEDLFNGLTQAAREDGTISNYTSVNEIMDSWTHKQGVPLIRVDIAGTNKIYLSQELFVKPPSRVSKSLEDGHNLWWIPVKIATKNKPEFKNRRLDFWIPSNTGTLLKTGVDTSDWLIVNPDSVGYYRVLYDDTLTRRIQKQLNNDPFIFSSSTRSQLLDDSFTLAFADYIKIERALDTTMYLSKETEYNAWNTVLRQLRRTSNLFSNTPGFKNFQNYLKPRINSALNLIGFEQKADERGLQVINRAQLFDWAGTLEDAQALEYSTRLFKAWMDSPVKNRIPLDLQPTVYCAAVRSGVIEDSTWNFVQKRYRESEPGRQKDLLQHALSCSKNATKIEALLYSTLETNASNAKIQRDEVGSLLLRIAANSHGRLVLFPFIQNEYKALIDFHKGSNVIASVVKTLATYFHAEQDFKDLKKFVETNAASLTSSGKSEAFQRSIVTTVEENRDWISKYYESMNDWFQNHV